MGGPATITVQHSPDQTALAHAACERAEDTLRTLETRYSRYRPDSLISQINGRAGSDVWTALDDEALALLQFCHTLWTQSAGLFDPTAGILRRVWDFKTRQPGNPEQIPELLQRVGWSMVSLEGHKVRLERPGMELDLGGVVKEYAADKVAQQLREQGLVCALIELAGDVVAMGEPRPGRPWSVGISDPARPTEALLTVELVNAALATSGNYQRVLEIGGKKYSHFLNPRSGWPVAGPASISVISDTCLTAGAVATGACLHDDDQRPVWLQRAGLPWLEVNEQGLLSGPLRDAHPGNRLQRT